MTWSQPAELELRVLVEDDAIEIVDADTERVERGADRAHRKARVVLLAAQSLLVDREFDLALVDDRDRAVVVVAGDSHYQHVTAPAQGCAARPKPSRSASGATDARAQPGRAAKR